MCLHIDAVPQVGHPAPLLSHYTHKTDTAALHSTTTSNCWPGLVRFYSCRLQILGLVDWHWVKRAFHSRTAPSNLPVIKRYYLLLFDSVHEVSLKLGRGRVHITRTV